MRYALRRSEAFLQEDAPYGSQRLLLEPDVILRSFSNSGSAIAELHKQTNCYTSHAIPSGTMWTGGAYGLHLPVLDIDDECGYDALPFLREVFQTPDVFFQRSTKNWHAYIGASPGGEYDQGITWGYYRMILRYLESVELVDPKWVDHSCAEGYSNVRKPGYLKPGSPTTRPPETCMWCGKPFPGSMVDDHEEECGR